MTMIRTSNMKKIYLSLIILITVFLSGCNWFKTELVSNTDYINLSIKANYIEYLTSYEEIPSYTLDIKGLTINTTKYRTGENEIIFSGNDDFVVSGVIEKLLKEYEQKNRISYKLLSTETDYETHLNKTIIEDGKEKRIKEYLKVKNGVIENKIAYMTLENGLQLTINFRTFEVENEDVTTRYYSWQTTESVRLILYFPLMVVKDSNGDKKILIVALPNGVINKVETRYEPSGLLEKDDFLSETYYTYEYSNYDSLTSGKDYSNVEEVKSIKEYYINNFNGRYENEMFLYDYLNYTFSIEFLDTTFIIRFVK